MTSHILHSYSVFRVLNTNTANLEAQKALTVPLALSWVMAIVWFLKVAYLAPVALSMVGSGLYHLGPSTYCIGGNLSLVCTGDMVTWWEVLALNV